MLRKRGAAGWVRPSLLPGRQYTKFGANRRVPLFRATCVPHTARMPAVPGAPYARLQSTRTDSLYASPNFRGPVGCGHGEYPPVNFRMANRLMKLEGENLK
jgi:hypothetical protein